MGCATLRHNVRSIAREASAAGRLRPNALVLTDLANFRVVGHSETFVRSHLDEKSAIR
jgi:hypothetical protein